MAVENIPRMQIVKSVTTLLILLLVFHFVEWSKLLAAFRETEPAFYVLSSGAFIASFLFLAARLRILLVPTDLSGFSWWQLLKIHLSSMFYGFFVPSDLGTAAVRWYRITANRRGRAVFILITLLERLITVISALFLVIIALYLTPDPAAAEFRKATLPALLIMWLLLVLLFCVFLFRPLYRLANSGISTMEEKFAKRRIIWVLSVFRGIGIYLENPRILVGAWLLQIPFQGLLLVRFIWLFQALDIELPLLDVVWVSMLCALVALLPITIAGLGLREGGFVALLSLFAVPPEIGVLLGLLTFSQIVVVLLLGGVSALVDSKRWLPSDTR